MKIKCKFCGSELSVPDAADGKMARCSHCNKVFVVKGPMGVPAIQLAANDPPSMSRSSVLETTDGSDHQGTASRQQTAKFCPHCGEPAEKGDLFCANCGSRLPDRTRDEPVECKKPVSPSSAGTDAGTPDVPSPVAPLPAAVPVRHGRCKHCGHSVPVGTTPCPHCGHELKWPKPQPNRAVPARTGVPGKTRLTCPETDGTVSLAPIVLGVLCLVGSLIPIVGVPLAIAGLVVSGMKKSMIGACLCTVGLVLGIVNAIAGSHRMAQMEREREARERFEKARESLEQLRWSFE